jgi:hypothetical protein
VYDYIFKTGIAESTYVSSQYSQRSAVIYFIMRIVESRPGGRAGGRFYPMPKGAAALRFALSTRTVAQNVYRH